MDLLRLPSGVKLAQLKAIAVACGLPSSGTKAALQERLWQTYRNVQERENQPLFFKPLEQRILSVDLGIRNLAYSLITPTPLPAAGRGKLGIPPAHSATLKVWTRVSLGRYVESGKKAAGMNAEASDNWSPTTMANVALMLVRGRFMLLKPTHILIERQRFRSGGAAAVQEWTLRVNTLESMIHAVLRTLRDVGVWQGEVISIPPSRVGPFWLNDPAATMDSDLTEEEEYWRSTKTPLKSAKARNKQAKIDFVGDWLRQQNMLRLWDQPSYTAKGYLAHLDSKRGRRKEIPTKKEGPTKKGVPTETVAPTKPFVPTAKVDLFDKLGALTDSVLLKEVPRKKGLPTEEADSFEKLDAWADSMLKAHGYSIKLQKKKKDEWWTESEDPWKELATGPRNESTDSVQESEDPVLESKDPVQESEDPVQESIDPVQDSKDPGRAKMEEVPNDGEALLADHTDHTKLDDLADCLLQGMAWIEWEKNRTTLARDGATKLLAKL